ncbi:DJ-1/PfpI family protein [Natronococcus occultus]|uniref:Transcriptional regulator containing an amidase domain and an AraC-type DNA-binding HTH domain n=1 Tax=Natronococcus occultus SP4 TaxID=694430 RepID=L0K4S2_9EURY|nr:DJ-1/PfpI family protein [Natronococcus occultus]AGB39555.1 transcriptional regulator containing an amidase domain and an AraC-type DNA-binding HTH domain [Natronococcus occultus SP4]
MTDVTAEILLFEGFDELDAIGPYEVLKNGRAAGAALETRLVTLEDADAEFVTASHELRVEPDGTLGEPDLLVVPGGGWTSADGGVRTVVDDGAIPEAVDKRFAGGATVASVCTGAMILAEAGLLEGRPATTHHDALADLGDSAGNVVEERVVDDGDVLTAGGVTAGIDLALWLLEREFGAEVAEAVETEMEHERRGEVFG